MPHVVNYGSPIATCGRYAHETFVLVNRVLQKCPLQSITIPNSLCYIHPRLTHTYCRTSMNAWFLFATHRRKCFRSSGVTTFSFRCGTYNSLLPLKPCRSIGGPSSRRTLNPRGIISDTPVLRFRRTLRPSHTDGLDTRSLASHDELWCFPIILREYSTTFSASIIFASRVPSAWLCNHGGRNDGM